ncbi:MAG: chemotaxis protein CheW [Limnobacter sp.]|nr:chemotaxis protein CheW [Limnobacter sp.]
MQNTLTGATQYTHGLFRCGDFLCVIAVDNILEATYLRSPLKPQEGSNPALSGAAQFRGLWLPVCDTEVLLGKHTQSRSNFAMTMVVACNNQVLALGADEVLGFLALRSAQVTRLTPAQNSTPTPAGLQICSSHYSHPQSGEMLTELDLNAVANLPGIPCVLADANGLTNANNTPVNQAPGTQHEDECHYLLARLGHHHVLVDAEQVNRLFPAPHIQPLDGTEGMVLGVTEDDFGRLPIVDANQLCGLPQNAGATATKAKQVLLLKMVSNSYIGLAVDEILEVFRSRPLDIVHLPRLGTGHMRFLNGVCELQRHKPKNAYSSAHTPYFLDLSPIAQNPELLEVAKLYKPGDNTPTSNTGQAAGKVEQDEDMADLSKRLMVVQMGSAFCVFVDQIEEVLPFPAHFDVNQRENGTAFIGLYFHRGRCIQLVDLHQRLCGKPGLLSKESPVLVVQSQAGYCGFVVQRLSEIAQPLWLQDHASFDGDQAVMGELPHRYKAKVRVNNQENFFPVIDLLRDVLGQEEKNHTSPLNNAAQTP